MYCRELTVTSVVHYHVTYFVPFVILCFVLLLNMYPSCFFCRQLREQSKKLVGVKRNQQLEREKQAQLLNEVKKQEDQKDETADFHQVKYSHAFTVVVLKAHVH